LDQRSVQGIQSLNLPRAFVTKPITNKSYESQKNPRPASTTTCGGEGKERKENRVGEMAENPKTGHENSP
jgi:hypothetical protein